MPGKAGSSPALRNEADPEHYHGEAFSPLAPWCSDASCVGGYLQACFRELLRPP